MATRVATRLPRTSMMSPGLAWMQENRRHGSSFKEHRRWCKHHSRLAPASHPAWRPSGWIKQPGRLRQGTEACRHLQLYTKAWAVASCGQGGLVGNRNTIVGECMNTL
jgi:hypothetical protein